MRPRDMRTRSWSRTMSNRPGLQLAGFFDYFDSSRLQILGRSRTRSSNASRPKAQKGLRQAPVKATPAIIISRGLDPFPECLEMARKYNTPVLRSIDPTSYLVSALIASLKTALAPRITRHGVLVEVYGEGSS